MQLSQKVEKVGEKSDWATLAIFAKDTVVRALMTMKMGLPVFVMEIFTELALCR